MNRPTSLIILLIAIFSITILAPACTPAATGPATPIPTLTPLQIIPHESSTPEPTFTPAPTRTFAPTPTLDPNAPVWIANPADRTVIGIDPNTNTIIDTIPIRGQVDMVITALGGIWALDRQRGLIYRIDPQIRQIVSRITLPEGQAQTIAAGVDALYVGMTGTIDLNVHAPGEEAPARPGWVVQIDPVENKVVNQFAVQPVSRLAASGPLVWVLSSGEIDTPVELLDVPGNQGMAVPLHNAPDWFLAEALAVDDQNLWLFSTVYNKIYHATTTGYILSAIPLDGQQPTGYADLLLTGSGLWAATPWGTVLHIDPATNHIRAKIELGVPLTQLIAGPQAIWALSQQTATLFRIDPQTGQVAAEIVTGSPLQPTVVPTPTPRLNVWKPCPDAPTSRLAVGDIAYVTKDPPMANRIRKEANREADIIGYISPGGGMMILEGPACADGWVWWKVKNAEVQGWTAEGDSGTYWLVPLLQ